MRIVDIILRLERHLNQAKKLVNEDLSNYYIFNTLAMECFQTVNSLIELGEYIVSEKRLGFPSTYSEIFELLYKNKIIDEKTLKSFKRLIFLRNLIAHEYYKIKEKDLKEIVDLLKYIEKFLEKVKKEFL